MHLVGKLDAVKSFVSNLNWKVDVTEAYFFVRYISGTWIYCAQWSKDKFNLLLMIKEKITSAMNHTQTPFTILSDEKIHGFSIDDFWERELSFFCEAILENRKIWPCDIEGALQ